MIQWTQHCCLAHHVYRVHILHRLSFDIGTQQYFVGLLTGFNWRFRHEELVIRVAPVSQHRLAALGADLSFETCNFVWTSDYLLLLLAYQVLGEDLEIVLEDIAAYIQYFNLDF